MISRQLPLILLIVAGMINTAWSSESRVKTRFVSSPHHVKYTTTVSAGRPVLAGLYGVVNIVGDSPERDSIVFLPTVSTIESIEPTQDGYIAVTDGRQVFRTDEVGAWQLIRSYRSDHDLFLSLFCYAVNAPDTVFVFANEDDTPILTAATDGRRVTCCMDLPSGRVGIGFDDGAVWVLDTGADTVEQYHIPGDPVIAITDDIDGALVVTNESGTWRLNTEQEFWNKYVPQLIIDNAEFGRDYRMFIRREQRAGNAVYTTVAVYDTLGARGYNALLVRSLDDPFEAWTLPIMELYFPAGPWVWIGSADNIIAASSVPGQYNRIRADGNLGWIESRPDFGPNESRQGGAMTRAVGGELLWTTSLLASPLSQDPTINLIHTLDTLGRLSTDTLQSLPVLPKGAVNAVIETDDHTAYLYRNMDTMIVRDHATNDLDFQSRVLAQDLHFLNEQGVAWSGSLVSFTTDHGATWMRKRRSFATPVLEAQILPDGRCVCVTTNLVQSTISVTTDQGLSWDDHIVDGAWGMIAGYRDGRMVLLPRQTGLDDVSLHVTLLQVDLQSGDSFVALDTTLSYSGRVLSGVFMGDELFLVVRGEAGLLRVTPDLHVVEQVDTTFRVPNEASYLARDVRADWAVLYSQEGWMIELNTASTTSVDENILRVFIDNVYPMPTSSRINCSLLMPFIEDLTAATAGLYDLSGQLVADLTPDLRRARYAEGRVDFSCQELSVTSGAYVLVVRAGRSVSSKNIIFRQ